MRFSVAAVLALIPFIAASKVPSWDDPSTTLYVTSPACGFFKCEVLWHAGEEVTVNWLNSPKGKVEIVLEASGDGPSYVVAKSIQGRQPETQCDGGNGVGKKGRSCGAYTFSVPASWKLGNYSIAVHSLTTKDIGYTDIVHLTSKNQKPSKSKGKTLKGKGKSLKGKGKSLKGKGKSLKGKGKSLKSKGKTLKGKGKDLKGKRPPTSS